MWHLHLINILCCHIHPYVVIILTTDLILPATYLSNSNVLEFLTYRRQKQCHVSFKAVALKSVIRPNT